MISEVLRQLAKKHPDWMFGLCGAQLAISSICLLESLELLVDHAIVRNTAFRSIVFAIAIPVQLTGFILIIVATRFLTRNKK